MLSSLRPSTWPAAEVGLRSGPLPSIPPNLAAVFLLASLPVGASGQRRHSFGNGFELADGLAAEDKRDEGADRHDHKYRAEKDRRRTSVWFHQEWCKAAGEQPPERLAEDMPAPAQCRRELLGQIDAGGGEGRQHREAD